MPDVSSHVPGSFAWVELSTTDQNGGVAFYRSLFGWDVNEMPMGPGETYSMFKMRDRDVGAAYTMRPEEKQAGAPPHWNMYVAVENADATVEKAKELGAGVLAPAFDVMDAGRMAVLQDPAGAVFSIWQPKTHLGVQITNEPGSLCWSETTTRDTKKAEAFYTKLFGWTAKHSAPSSQMEYTEFSAGERSSIGMMPMPKEVPPFVPSYWMPYFQVTACDASVAKAKSLGAKLMVGPHDIADTGRFAILNDPQGAMFAVFSPKAS